MNLDKRMVLVGWALSTLASFTNACSLTGLQLDINFEKNTSSIAANEEKILSAWLVGKTNSMEYSNIYIDTTYHSNDLKSKIIAQQRMENIRKIIGLMNHKNIPTESTSGPDNYNSSDHLDYSYDTVKIILEPACTKVVPAVTSAAALYLQSSFCTSPRLQPL